MPVSCGNLGYELRCDGKRDKKKRDEFTRGYRFICPFDERVPETHHPGCFESPPWKSRSDVCSFFHTFV